MNAVETLVCFDKGKNTLQRGENKITFKKWCFKTCSFSRTTLKYLTSIFFNWCLPFVQILLSIIRGSTFLEKKVVLISVYSVYYEGAMIDSSTSTRQIFYYFLLRTIIHHPHPITSLVLNEQNWRSSLSTIKLLQITINKFLSPSRIDDKHSGWFIFFLQKQHTEKITRSLHLRSVDTY